ncbi:MAG TPA: glycosyltransferase family 87 protein [Candidatus Dormibacteraeota bacterium]|nr:glycosyltransferase family 87 protein [Candidatus Dormibacteraeota bacterium]
MTWLRAPFFNRPYLKLVVMSALAVNQLWVLLENHGMILRRPGYSDFGLYYLYARVGLHQGWSHLYDAAAQHQEWLRVGGDAVVQWFPIVYLPPLPWVVVPFTVLPLPLAYICWSALLVACSLLTWRLVAPRYPAVDRWTALASMLAIAAVPYALLLGQILIVQLAAIAVAWWLLKRRQDSLAGLALLALVFKPQIAILLPVILLVIGRWRALAAWVAGSGLIAALAVSSTGLNGFHEYLRRVGDAASAAPQFFVPSDLTLAGFFGRGPLALGLSVAVVGLTLVAAYRNRRSGPALPISCALAGSMAVTPYLHSQDLATLFLAGGIALTGGLDRWRRWMLIAGYALLLAYSYWDIPGVGTVLGALILSIEIAWLLALSIVPQSGAATDRRLAFTEEPLDRSA